MIMKVMIMIIIACLEAIKTIAIMRMSFLVVIYQL